MLVPSADELKGKYGIVGRNLPDNVEELPVFEAKGDARRSFKSQSKAARCDQGIECCNFAFLVDARVGNQVQRPLEISLADITDTKRRVTDVSPKSLL